MPRDDDLGHGPPSAVRPSELPITRDTRSARFWTMGVLAAVVAVLVIALATLLPPLMHQNRTPPAAPPPAAGPPPPPPGGGCPPPIPPPPDAVDGRPPGGGPPPGLPGKCPPPPADGGGYHLLFTGRQVDVSPTECSTRIDLDAPAITQVPTDTDLTYQPCGKNANLVGVTGRPFGEFGIFPPTTAEECRGSALGRPVRAVPQTAPHLLGYCVITSSRQIAHVLVQVWGAPARPELKIQITLWRMG